MQMNKRGNHLPPHKYIKNTSTSGTTPTEHIQNTGRGPQASKKARKSPRTWVGQKKKEKIGTKEPGQDLCLWEGATKKEKFPHTRKPLHWQRRRGGRGNFRVMEENATIVVQRAKQRDYHTKDWCQPALTNLRGLSAHTLGRVGAGS